LVFFADFNERTFSITSFACLLETFVGMARAVQKFYHVHFTLFYVWTTIQFYLELFLFLLLTTCFALFALSGLLGLLIRKDWVSAYWVSSRQNLPFFFWKHIWTLSSTGRAQSLKSFSETEARNYLLLY
jgi:hypothetical protein